MKNSVSSCSSSRPGCALGRQMTVEFYDCDARILTDAGQMEKIFTTSARKAGATVISSHFHSFMPQGVSGVVVISESHFAVHAWPEHEYAAVDLFTCGENVDFTCAVESIASGLGSEQWVISSLIDRGIVGNNGVERVVPITEGRDHHSFQLSWKSRFEKTSARALSVAVDLYESRLAAEETALKESVCRFAEKSGFSLEGSAQVTVTETGLKLAVSLVGGWLNILWNKENRSVHLDIFNESFFDPREAAERALESFSCSFYRMQPHVRQ